MDLPDLEELPEPTGVYSLMPEGADAQPTSKDFTGKAKAVYPNGDIFIGEFDNGLRHGKGVYITYETKDKFDGNFEANMKTGLGRVTYKKGGFYHGHFKDNKRDGEGTFRYANGDIYSGMWQEGQRHGKGTYVFTKTKYESKGEWKNGQLVAGTWSLAGGPKYVGYFKNQKPCGDGIWQTPQGTIVEGAYVQQVVPVDDPASKKAADLKTETRIFWKTATMVATEA